MKTENLIGIDLGTTFSEVAYLTESGVPEVVPNLDGDVKTPSVVSYAADPPVVGKAALPDVVLNPDKVIRCGKRSMGKRTPAGQLIPLWVSSSGESITPIDFQARILAFQKQSAEQYLGRSVERAVVTIPAYFDELARQDTLQAAKQAGFKEVKLLNEPEAAAICYGLEKNTDEIVVVVDIGGGTTDVTGMQIRDGKIDVIATDGEAEIGGVNYDESLMQLIQNHALHNKMEISAQIDLALFNVMLERGCQAKELLARRQETVVIIEAACKRIPFTVTRPIFLDAVKELDEKIRACCGRLSEILQQRGKKPTKILMVGGSSRLFQMEALMEGVFGIEPSRDADPDLVVARGAAIWAQVCFGAQDRLLFIGGHRYLASQIQKQTVAAHAICVAARRARSDLEEYNCPLIPANSVLPFDFQEKFAPANPGAASVEIKLVNGKPDELSSRATVIRHIHVPIQPSEHDQDRILLKGCYNEEGLLELTILDELLGTPVNEAFVYKPGIDTPSENVTQIARKRVKR